MKNLKTNVTIILWILSVVVCDAQTVLSRLSFSEGKTTVIKDVVDMEGAELMLPKNVTLKFAKGGCLKNGCIKADNTSISGYKQGIFDGVKVEGEWNVKYICTDMFKDLVQLNSLQNVFALASEKVTNVIIIEEGKYQVAANRNFEAILSVPSNTEVIINGTIMMLPNAFTNYYIIELKGENIQLHGRGDIVGDKHTHIGTQGEWGMGVQITRCKNVDIYDFTIKDCWGDCIYIGSESTDVRINNCILIHGRRQGISITSADNVNISNCKISKVGGSAPQYGIDIEPNKGGKVDNVIIENVEIFDCYGGILTYGKAENAQIGSVVIKGCKVYDCAAKYPLNFQTGQSVDVIDCAIKSGGKTAVLFQNLQNASAVNNVLISSNKHPIKVILGQNKVLDGNTIIKE